MSATCTEKNWEKVKDYKTQLISNITINKITLTHLY